MEGKPHNLDISADGNILYTANMETNDVSVIDLTNRTVIKKIKVSEGHHRIDVTPDGSRLFVAVSGEKQVVEIDTEYLEIIRRISAEGFPFWLAVTGNQ